MNGENKATIYLDAIIELLQKIKETQLPKINQLAECMTEAIAAKKRIFLFGTGHSVLLAQEIFYRAGGLVPIYPMLESSLMLHESASKSTKLERVAAYAAVLFEEYDLQKDEILVVISNSGRNALCVELALQAKRMGVQVVALTSCTHSQAEASRHESGLRLMDVAELILDNQGCIGDACIPFPELNAWVAPTSTAVGAAMLQATVAQTVAYLLERGISPEIFKSSNVDGGDEENERFLKKYRKEIRCL
ncbi:MAG: SIS domain-containing protein [Oscillospiraceae bacterium]|jgi:uncharacterized phosphosugar-binding protein|nr:SIS domain-containing protein [Oscillospiraceae bacterium]